VIGTNNMKMKATKMVRPDAKGRIALGKLANGVSRFAIIQTSDNKIILIPYAEIPAKEKWIFTNKKILSQIKKGIKESGKNQLRKGGSFKKYLDIEIE
jgi:hypothetical protein